MKRISNKWIVAPLLSIALILASLSSALVQPASTASATATGCSWYGKLQYESFFVYNGSYCATINNIPGNTTWVSTVVGSFSSIGNICNWSATAEFFDVYGKWYKTYKGSTQYGCFKAAKSTVPVYSQMKKGRMCSTFKSNGYRITSVCHSLY